MTTTCPACAHPLLPIEYGLPGPEMIGAAERGEIALGGCCVLVGPPGDDRHQCDGCRRRWLASPAGAPVVLCATIGGYVGEWIVVCVDVAGAVWRNDEQVGVVALDELWAELGALGVWTWRADYVDDAVLDGTSWSLRVQHADGDVAAGGRNDGPESFDALCALLSRITGSAFA